MFSSATKENAENIKKNTENLKHNIRVTADSAKQDMEHAMDSDTLNRFTNEAGRKVRSYYETASGSVNELADKMQDEIKNNPMRSSLMALGAGFILGVLLRR